MRTHFLTLLLAFLSIAPVALSATDTLPLPSVAGLVPLPSSGRAVTDFNPDWRFHLGEASGAEGASYDDTEWEVVTTPHTTRLMPAEDSGCRNYQGVAWYRKHFTAPAGPVTVLHFEAVMGRQRFYVNGRLVREHEGGYLPVEINLTEAGVRPGERVVVAVWTDNSDDKSYPPGKTQMTLDFCYHGGIYRDVWMIERGPVFITTATEAGRVAGGGIFAHYADVSESSARVFADTEVRNTLPRRQTVTVVSTLADATGRRVAEWRERLAIGPNATATSHQGSKIRSPHLWSPETPYLYTLTTKILGAGGRVIDGGQTRLGIRSFELRGADGLWLNGKRYRQLVGANRHQDFAYVGNAVPNSQQRRDVQRLKDAGFNIIRTAHYPQDPAFMDACDELGIFIIVATPGWQFWNKREPSFAEKVHENTRLIIRRDRNHPCVLMWEPILNETRYPADFAAKALQITRDEYPYPYRPLAAADLHSDGVLESYDVVYAWPGDDEAEAAAGETRRYEARAIELRKPMLTREYGEYVDDWYAHNNLNRASRSWGEGPQLTQALTLSNTTADQHRTQGLFLGGCLWHPFDHQRGYHPDPYWGGIYDAFRQPKTAYAMFHSQIPAAEDSAYVYIAHEMTQFSGPDVVVFSNCDSVRLSLFDGSRTWTLPVRHEKVLPDQGSATVETLRGKMKNEGARPYNAPVIFKNVWDFWAARELSYKQRAWQKVCLRAEGIIGGRVATTATRMPSRRATKLRLYADERGRQLVADGQDFIVVVCEVTDDSGNVRRLAKDEIRFTVEGEGTIIGEGTDIGANPRQVEWGSAPILVRSTRHAGQIRIHADVLYPGTHTPTPADLTIESVPALLPQCLDPTVSEAQRTRSVGCQPTDSRAHVSGSWAGGPRSGAGGPRSGESTRLTDKEKQRMLREVQEQQADFGVGK